MIPDMIQGAVFTAIFQGFAILAGCVLLRVLLPGNNVVTRFLSRVTAPIFKTVAVTTPAVLPVWSHGVWAIFWLLVLRVGFYLVMGATGLLPAVTSS